MARPKHAAGARRLLDDAERLQVGATFRAAVAILVDLDADELLAAVQALALIRCGLDGGAKFRSRKLAGLKPHGRVQ
ncbi:MAG TPA: hypothetical protein VJS92_17575 [Candidatus Polarisedimenticolaceae bacterium]|nr:hypothetical protein [Candidatus Polarisedimenticolaceae bacterium]